MGHVALQLLMRLLTCCPRCRHISTRIYSRTPGIPLHLPSARVPYIRLLGRGNVNLCCSLRRGSAVFSVGVVVVLVTLTKLSVSGRGDACLKLLCSSIANFPAVLKKQRAGPRIHSRPPYPNTWIKCVVCGPRITWLARSLHTCRNCSG